MYRALTFENFCQHPRGQEFLSEIDRILGRKDADGGHGGVHVRKGGAEVQGARRATREASKGGEGLGEDDEDMEPFMVRSNPCVSDMCKMSISKFVGEFAHASRSNLCVSDIVQNAPPPKALPYRPSYWISSHGHARSSSDKLTKAFPHAQVRGRLRACL